MNLSSLKERIVLMGGFSAEERDFLLDAVDTVANAKATLRDTSAHTRTNNNTCADHMGISRSCSLSDRYVIWSNEHYAWSGSEHRRYVGHLKQAGYYSRPEALMICRHAIPSSLHMERGPYGAFIPAEIMIPFIDAHEATRGLS